MAGIENNVRELTLDEAVKLVKEKKTKLVWLGTEPAEYLCEMLNVKETDMICLDPNEVLEFGKDKAKDMTGNVFLCYHGITSGFVTGYLQKEYNLEVYHLKGGISSIIGEM